MGGSLSRVGTTGGLTVRCLSKSSQVWTDNRYGLAAQPFGVRLALRMSAAEAGAADKYRLRVSVDWVGGSGGGC
jgi:hypothetical protein